jgi:hypothetical protein
MKKTLFALAAVCALSAVAAPAFSQDVTELLRADLRTTKTAIITEAMALDGPQSDVFWPIYREYEAELVTLNDEALAMIKDYAANYSTMTDELAKDLLKRGFKVRENRTKLLKKYSGKMEKSLSPRIAARWVQAEHAIAAVVDLQLAEELPLMK